MNPRPRRPPFAEAALVLVLSSSLFGCSSLDRFDTEGPAAYCGDLVSVPRFQGGLLPTGVKPPTLSLRVELDPNRLTARPEPSIDQPESYVIVGDVTSDDADRGLCSAVGRPLLDEAPLRTIPELDHDLLRLLEFGEGRDYNFMAWVDTTCQGTMLAVLSLMRNDSVEIRLLKPAPLAPPDVDPARSPGFGLFHLSREETGCGF